MSAVLLTIFNEYKVAERARPWILGALALSLLLAGYRVARPESREVGLERTRSELSLERAETVFDVIDPPHPEYLPRHNLSAVIAHYFDTYLPTPGDRCVH